MASILSRPQCVKRYNFNKLLPICSRSNIFSTAWHPSLSRGEATFLLSSFYQLAPKCTNVIYLAIWEYKYNHLDGLAKDKGCGCAIANALELQQSCAKLNHRYSLHMEIAQWMTSLGHRKLFRYNKPLETPTKQCLTLQSASRRFIPVIECTQNPVEIYNEHINTLRPRRYGRHVTDAILQCIILNDNVWITIKISSNFVPWGPIDNNRTLDQIITWCRPDDKPLSEPIMITLLTHICAIRRCKHGKLNVINVPAMTEVLKSTAAGKNFLTPHELQWNMTRNKQQRWLPPCATSETS